MKWKLGDFVRFVDERREGYITHIFDDQMIGVTGDDDFEIPVLASKVTSVYGHEASAAKRGEEQTVALQPLESFVKYGVHIAVVPDAKAASVVRFYLVNETSFTLLVTLASTQLDKHKGEFSGMIGPQSATEIYTAQLADIQLWPTFDLQALYFTPQNVKPLKPITLTEKFKAKDFSGAKKTIPVLNKAGWLIRIDEPEVILDPQKLKESFFKPAEEKLEIARPENEVDLHIEKLRDDYHFLNGSEILNIQLTHFKKALDAAIVHQMQGIVFIHGTGNGILKHELHKQLSKHPKVQTYMDAHKEKFGFGATRVVLK